jgi:tetratricopeptide (TPR) repeat protein
MITRLFRIPLQLLPLLLLLLLLSGCGSAQPPAPPLRQQAASYAREAAEAVQREDWANAERLTLAALDHYASLDDSASRFDLLLNSALIEQQRGALERADGALAAAAPLAGTDRQRLWLALRQASLALKRGDTAGAATALARGEPYCRESCTERPALLNLRARQALAAGKLAEAVNFASLAGKLAAPGSAEAANALRLQAQATLKQGQAILATGSFEAALAIDRQLGLSARVGEDLQGLAQAWRQAGNVEAARQTEQRAQAWRAGRTALGLP